MENLEGQPLFVNPAFCSFLGFSEEELRNKHCVDFSPREDAEKDWALFQQLKAGSIDHYQLEKRYFRKDGSLVWGRLSISLLNSRPTPLVVAMVQDITEKKRTQEDLELVSREMAAAVTRCSHDFRYLWANQGYADWLQRPLNEIVGHPIVDVLGGEAFETLLPHFKRVLAGQKVHYEQETNFQSLGKRWTSTTYTPTLDADGSANGWVAVVLDITERKRAEVAIRESEERFRTLAEAIPQLCWMAHGDGHIFWYNQRWYTYTGTTPEQMEGWGWQSVHDPQALPLVLERWKTSIATGEPFDMVFPIKAADGIFHPFLTRVTPVKDSKGSVVRWFGTNTDVTELRNAQEALSEMSRKLVQAQEKERSRIARELHDDINQRLAMLGIELEQLQENPSEVRSRVQELRKQTTELSNDVQALSHDLHSSQLEYLGVVAGMKSWCKEFGERQGMQIDCRQDVRSTLPQEIGLCLFRVVQEALHNASKHSGVKHIEVQLHEESGQIHLTIRDLGKGFDVEAAKKGRGLGLTSMQERVRLVNGTIEIQSKPRAGTTVHVRVPFASENASEPAVGVESKTLRFT